MKNQENKTRTERNLLKKLNKDNKISSVFGLLVVHPHSGKINRSVIETIIRHKSAGYDSTTLENVEYLKKYTNEYLILRDVNNKISGHFEKMPDYDSDGNLH